MGYRPTARELEALEEITTQLAVLRPGHDTVAAVLPDMHRLLQTETLVLLSPILRSPRWELERLHLIGFTDAQRMADTVNRFFQDAPRRYAWYDAAHPERSQRNRVIEAHRLMKDGELERSAIYQRWLYPERLHYHKQPRVLLCDGPNLLAWFGAFHSGAVDTRHRTLMRLLIEPLRRRLAIERDLDTTPRATAGLDAALAQLGAPAWIVDDAGVIHEHNCAGRALLDSRRSEVHAALRAALAGCPCAMPLELVPFELPCMRPAWLAVLRESRDARVDACIATATEQWNLSDRQREVLTHVVKGHANVTIALSLGIGERAVELHISAILEKAQANNRSALVAATLLLD